MADSSLSIRAALNRKTLADARQRTALARRFGFTEHDVLAIQPLARAGELTPASSQPGCSSPRAAPPPYSIAYDTPDTSLVTHIRATAQRRRALDSNHGGVGDRGMGPLVNTLDALAQSLSETGCEVITRFLERAADATARHADRLATDADAAACDGRAVPLPALWA